MPRDQGSQRWRDINIKDIALHKYDSNSCPPCVRDGA